MKKTSHVKNGLIIAGSVIVLAVLGFYVGSKVIGGSSEEPVSVDNLNTTVYDAKMALSQKYVFSHKSYFENAELTDCVNLPMGNDGGDLLSTLVADQDAREIMKLDVYSSDYATRLEKVISKGAKEKYNSDFYAFSVCHLSDKIDVVAGNLWPVGKETIVLSGSGRDWVPASGYGDDEVIVVVNDFSPVFFDNVQAFDNTATGDEVLPCKSKLSKDGKNVLWTCFISAFNESQNGEPVGPTMNEWTLPIDGSKATMREYMDLGDSLSSYNKWKLPQQIVENNFNYFRDDSTKDDCVGLENGITGGGDLLSTLIVDNAARDTIKLEAYSSDYVIKLEKAIANGAKEKYNSDFYAFKVCHLSDNVDAVAGILWPTGKSTLQTDGKFEGDVVFGFGDNRVIAVVKDFFPVFFDDVQTLNNTATGGEVMPCGSKLSDDGQNVLWTCFRGLYHNTEESVDGSNMTEWILPIDGGATTKRDYVDRF